MFIIRAREFDFIKNLSDKLVRVLLDKWSASERALLALILINLLSQPLCCAALTKLILTLAAL
jgi:hypothetical protein